MSERYQIKAKIGQGGIGAVYRAFDTHLQREVAVKRLLPPDESEAFEEDPTKTLFKEAHLLSALQHPNVVSVYDVGTDDDGVFVVMELVDGETFDQVVDRGLLTEADFAEMVAQTLEALIAAQDKDLVHRDIKPTNLMVKWLPSGKFQFKLLDFGLAKFSPKPTRQTIGLNDAILGSIHFMAPEQFERLPLDCRTDLYAMGCMFYYGLGGRYPFDGDTAAEVMAAHLQHRVAPLHEVRSDISQRSCDWVMWLMNREMDARPKSAHEALDVFFNHEMPVPGASFGTPGIGAPRPILPTRSPGAPVVKPVTGVVPTPPHTGSVPVRLGSGPVRHPSGPVTPGSGPVRPVSAPVRLGSGAVLLRGTGSVPLPHAGGVPPAPGSTGTGAVEVAAPQALPQAKKPSSVKKWTIISLTSAGLILGVTAAVIFGSNDDKQSYAEVINYLNADDPIGDAAWVERLVPYLNPPRDAPDREELVRSVKKRLGEMEGEGVEAELLNQLENTSGMTQETLIAIVANRNIADAVGPLTRVALAADPSSATRAIEAFSVLGETRDAGTIMEAMINADDAKLRRMGEDVLAILIDKAERREDLVPFLEKGLDDAVPMAVQQSAIRLLGRTGATSAGRVVARVLESDNPDLQGAAITALRDWPDDTQIDRLATLAGDAPTDVLQDLAWDAYLRALAFNQDRNRQPDRHEGWWRKALELAGEDKARKMGLLNRIAGVPEKFAVDIASAMMTDSDPLVRNYAAQAKAQIERLMRKRG